MAPNRGVISIQTLIHMAQVVCQGHMSMNFKEPYIHYIYIYIYL